MLAGWLARSFPVEQADRRNYIFSSGEAECQPLVVPCPRIRMCELMKVLSSNFTVCNKWKVCTSSTKSRKGQSPLGGYLVNFPSHRDDQRCICIPRRSWRKTMKKTTGRESVCGNTSVESSSSQLSRSRLGYELSSAMSGVSSFPQH